MIFFADYSCGMQSIMSMFGVSFAVIGSGPNIKGYVVERRGEMRRRHRIKKYISNNNFIIKCVKVD